MIAGSFGQKFQNNSPDLFPEVVSNRFNKNFQLTSGHWASQSYRGAGLVFSTVLKTFNVKRNKAKQHQQKDKGSLCIPGCTWVHDAVHAGLEYATSQFSHLDGEVPGWRNHAWLSAFLLTRQFPLPARRSNCFPRDIKMQLFFFIIGSI